MSEIELEKQEFYVEYPLSRYRQISFKSPAAHQVAALSRLRSWFDGNQTGGPFGGILVLPTGGGKTFTSLRYLCDVPVSQGYKVLWLAHTHHLLEQAFGELASHVGRILEPKQRLNVRVVSGTPGHCRVHHIKPSDDFVIGTLQTITGAWRNQHPALIRFLEEAGSQLCVVFDEAHHSPATTYRNLLLALRQKIPTAVFLGLTATPKYTDERKQGWLKTLFPQGIVHQVAMAELQASRILAKPIFEQCSTQYSVDIDEREYLKWKTSYGDIPESIVAQLAESRERNQAISETYINNRSRYGKTIIFADRWFQCEAIKEFLSSRGVRAGCLYTHQDATPGTPEGRYARTADDNKNALHAFRNGELDVLVNVRMLTEGTDVPSVQTVFITRQTTSSILLTQMIGRALRGPAFGGTEEAFVVSFVDDWKQLINWAQYEQLVEREGLADDASTSTRRLPLQFVSIELVQSLARQMDYGGNVSPAPFLSLMPAGWYQIEFEAIEAGGDDSQSVIQMMMVFDAEVEAHKRFVDCLVKEDLSGIDEPCTKLSEHISRIDGWIERFFGSQSHRSLQNLRSDLFHLARHVAQQGSVPAYFPFEERRNHNLDELAAQYIESDIGPRQKNDRLQAEYARTDGRYWRVIYPSYHLFKSQYDACENRLIGLSPISCSEPDRPEFRELREPSNDVKEQVKRRDGNRCLCCGETDRKRLEIDHVAPNYMGGGNDLSNLQTLCKVCNNGKGGLNEINFRNNSSLITVIPDRFQRFDVVDTLASDPKEWDKALRRAVNFFYRCAAVDTLRLKKRGIEIVLFDGNNPDWLAPHANELLGWFQTMADRLDFARLPGVIAIAPGRSPVCLHLDSVEVFEPEGSEEQLEEDATEVGFRKAIIVQDDEGTFDLGPIDPISARAFIEANPQAYGEAGEAILSVFADCIIDAHRAGPGKWRVALGWKQPTRSGLFALTFGTRFICSHCNGKGLRICLDSEALDNNLKNWYKSHHEKLANLPTSMLIDLKSTSQWKDRIRPAFRALCEKANEVSQHVQMPQCKIHSPGLLEYLRQKLNRPEIPDPSWWTPT